MTKFKRTWYWKQVIEPQLKERDRLDKRYRSKKSWEEKVKNYTPEQKWEHEQFMLMHKLLRAFNHKEFIVYDELPDALKAEIRPFTEELVYPPKPQTFEVSKYRRLKQSVTPHKTHPNIQQQLETYKHPPQQDNPPQGVQGYTLN